MIDYNTRKNPVCPLYFATTSNYNTFWKSSVYASQGDLERNSNPKPKSKYKFAQFLSKNFYVSEDHCPLNCSSILKFNAPMFNGWCLFQAAVSNLKQDYKEGEMTLESAQQLAIKVLSKTLDMTKLTSEKGEKWISVFHCCVACYLEKFLRLPTIRHYLRCGFSVLTDVFHNFQGNNGGLKLLGKVPSSFPSACIQYDFSHRYTVRDRGANQAMIGLRYRYKYPFPLFWVSSKCTWRASSRLCVQVH